MINLFDPDFVLETLTEEQLDGLHRAMVKFVEQEEFYLKLFRLCDSDYQN